MTFALKMAQSVTPYEPGDREALRIFQRKFFGADARHCDDAFFDWLYEQNPNRRPGVPALWLCKKDGVVVGQQGSVPIVLRIDDRLLSASWGIDLMVEPAWRLRGVGPALSACFEGTADVALGFGISEPAYKAYLRGGWRDLSGVRTFVRLFDLEALLLAESAPNWLRRIVPWVPKSAVRGSARTFDGILRTGLRLSLEPVARFDDRVDGVWRAASGDGLARAVRDFANLRWRYDEIPTRTAYDRFYLLRRGEVIGYVVTRWEEWRGRVVVRVIDYLCKECWNVPLFALIVARMSEEKAAAVFMELSPTHATSALRVNGFVPIQGSTRFMCKPSARTALSAAFVEDAARWFVTSGDSDRSHAPLEIPSGMGTAFGVG